MSAGTAVQPRRGRTAASDTALRHITTTTRAGPGRLGRNVLLLADGENLSYGLRRHGFDLDFGRLRQLVAARSGRLHAHAYATVPGADARQYAQAYFARTGWQHHVQLAETVRTCRGTELRANSDPAILLGCGELAALLRPDAVVIATGDGDLGSDIARFLKSGRARPQVVVCSIAGATSQRLLAAHNTDIDANLWLGWDCMVSAH